MQYKKSVKSNKKSLFEPRLLQKHPTPAAPFLQEAPRASAVPFLSIADNIGNYPFN